MITLAHARVFCGVFHLRHLKYLHRDQTDRLLFFKVCEGVKDSKKQGLHLPAGGGMQDRERSIRSRMLQSDLTEGRCYSTEQGKEKRLQHPVGKRSGRVLLCRKVKRRRKRRKYGKSDLKSLVKSTKNPKKLENALPCFRLTEREK